MNIKYYSQAVSLLFQNVQTSEGFCLRLPGLKMIPDLDSDFWSQLKTVQSLLVFWTFLTLKSKNRKLSVERQSLSSPVIIRFSTSISPFGNYISLYLYLKPLPYFCPLMKAVGLSSNQETWPENILSFKTLQNTRGNWDQIIIVSLIGIIQVYDLLNFANKISYLFFVST